MIITALCINETNINPTPSAVKVVPQTEQNRIIN